MASNVWSPIFAHSLQGGGEDEWETLSVHGKEVSRRASEFAGVFGWAAMASATGLLHDVGKASEDFQAYIRGLRDKGGDHSTFGARIAQQLYGNPGRILAHCIAGHHAGLQDGEDLARRLDPVRTTIPDAGRWPQCITAPEKADLRPTRALQAPDPARRHSFAYSFLIRMLFSCLVDADFLATERFMANGPVARGIDVGLDVLQARLQTYVAHLRRIGQPTPLNALRREIFDHAVGKAGGDPGLFTLTVPTGGGKTLTSLAFGLEHARLKAKRRIVYVIPFTAIIEQTASIFREALGDDVVLEHHAAFDWEESERGVARDGGDERDGLGLLRRAAENWDAPIVVTTAVQFFESLFANRTSRCRKLHNLADSIIILDEAQTLPTSLLLPCLSALEELTINYGASVVLCTATQPAVRRGGPLVDPVSTMDHGLLLDEGRELAPRSRQLYEKLRRVHVRVLPGETSDDVVMARFAEQTQMLCIVNSRAHARDLFDRISTHDGAVHLTTLMCPAHRREVLADLKAKLKACAPVRLVSTSLIEAGVDISFAEVWRAAAGVDQIAQAAGRCNREGELLPLLGRVVVFTPADHKPPRSLAAFQQAAAGVLRDHADDLLGLDAVEAYFHQLYFQKGVGALDATPIHEQPGILAALRRNAQGLLFPFRSIAEAFRMIDETMQPVVVPWNEEARDALKRVEEAPYVPVAYLRKLQQFTVGIPKHACNAWLALDAIRPVQKKFGTALLRFENTDLYRDRTGIDLNDPTFRNAESNIW